MDINTLLSSDWFAWSILATVVVALLLLLFSLRGSRVKYKADGNSLHALQSRLTVINTNHEEAMAFFHRQNAELKAQNEMLLLKYQSLEEKVAALQGKPGKPVITQVDPSAGSKILPATDIDPAAEEIAVADWSDPENDAAWDEISEIKPSDDDAIVSPDGRPPVEPPTPEDVHAMIQQWQPLSPEELAEVEERMFKTIEDMAARKSKED